MNTAWAIHILDGLARGGVSHLALCPGSRSTPLALAARAHPNLHVRVVLDERSAAFWALGIAKSTGRPAAVLTTSGTAVANLLPAVVEASNAAVPLVVLTADRPEELRGRGSNQTIEQRGIFGAFVRFEADLAHPAKPRLGDLDQTVSWGMAAAQGHCPGPVHFNQPLREPLAPSKSEQALLEAIAPVVAAPPTRHRDPAQVPALTGSGIIVAGPGPVSAKDATIIQAAAQTLGAPVLADALSGLRSSEVICRYDAWIGAVAPEPDWIVQFGAAPTSKALGSWLRGMDDRRVRIDATGRRWDEGSPTWVDGEPAEVLEAMAEVASGALPDPRWKAADDAAAHALDPAGTEAAAMLAAARWAQAADSTLFAGNSLAVRDLDRYGGPILPRVLGNRGASGIDGNLATLAGIAAGTGPAVGVMGDLAFQHDVGSLALLRDAPARVVVVQNGGGGIFRHLPVAQSTPHFEELFLTPQHFDVGAACAAFGVSHVRVPVDEVHDALTGPATVVEAVVADAAASARRRSELALLAAGSAAEAWRQS